MGWSEILVSNGCFGSLFDHFTLGARDFSSAVSGFCQQGQVFIVTRSLLRPPGGGGVLSYITYTGMSGMCRPTGS